MMITRTVVHGVGCGRVDKVEFEVDEGTMHDQVEGVKDDRGVTSNELAVSPRNSHAVKMSRIYRRCDWIVK